MHEPDLGCMFHIFHNYSCWVTNRLECGSFKIYTNNGSGWLFMGVGIVYSCTVDKTACTCVQCEMLQGLNLLFPNYVWPDIYTKCQAK